jgi:hypothetical protein
MGRRKLPAYITQTIGGQGCGKKLREKVNAAPEGAFELRQLRQR